VLSSRKEPVPEVFFASPRAKHVWNAGGGGARRLAVDLARGADLGQHRARDAHQLEARLVPVEALEIHQHRATRVGHVGHVHAAFACTCEVPEHPRVDRAERQLAVLRALARALDMLEQPRHLRTGEVRRERQADTIAQAVGALLARELAHELVGARVLPHECVVDRLTAGAIPHDSALALVGYAERRDVADGDVGLREGAVDHLAGALPDLARVVLDPTRLRSDLLVLALVERDDPPVPVEQDEARARRPLIDRSDVLRHPLRGPPRLSSARSRSHEAALPRPCELGRCVLIGRRRAEDQALLAAGDPDRPCLSQGRECLFDCAPRRDQSPPRRFPHYVDCLRWICVATGHPRRALSAGKADGE
jgi:hypothetical protein